MNSRPAFAKAFQGKRVLITGGLGFIGSNLARRLVALGAKVTLIDSLIPEYGGNMRNIRGLERKLNVNISDVRNHHGLPVVPHEAAGGLREDAENLSATRLPARRREAPVAPR